MFSTTQEELDKLRLEYIKQKRINYKNVIN